MPAESEGHDKIDPDEPMKDDQDVNEKVWFTAEELRAMDAEGLTLGDGIRAIEARLG